VIGSVIGLLGVGLTVWATVHVADDGDKGTPDSKPTVSAPSPTVQSSADDAPQEQTSPTPSTGPSSQAPADSYAVVYKDRKVGISYGGFDVGTLDLDKPRAQEIQGGDYQTMKRDAKAEGKVLEPDLLYYTDDLAELLIEDGRTAVQTDTAPPTEPQQCAADAEAGGFDAIQMYEWPLDVGSGFCVITDQGNVVRLQITRFVGGDRSLARNPDRIEFNATMWRPSQS
jgi:hypothetical protein